MSLPSIERTTIGEGMSIPRMISGLWQLVDDKNVDLDAASRAMERVVDLGLDCFDMADHYGDAELVVGRFRATSSQNMLAFTKWCPPENGIKSFDAAQQAVDLALQRMGQEQITLMQYHIWDYSDDTYWHNLVHLRTMQEQGKIKHIGLTNVDAAHLELLIDTGFKITTNQVSCSVLDRRLVRGRLASVCEKHNVGVLAYGTLLGGFLSEKWLDQPEPEDMNVLNGSLRKYLRFIRAAGGWEPFQGLLRALSTIAHAHDVSIPAVATRYVLEIPTVSAVIVGCRLSAESSEYAKRNLEAFSFRLTETDHALIRKAQQALLDIPGDCGDEYRRPPYLTAAGDLSHHIKYVQNDELREAIAAGKRIEYSTGSPWEPIAGYCRAVRKGNNIYISGTTANSPGGLGLPVLGGHSARSQTVAVLDIIGRALKALGGTLLDVVRTRIIVRNEADCEEVSRAHGWAFQCEGVRPSNTLFVANLVGLEYLVEIEAEAHLGSDGVLGLSIELGRMAAAITGFLSNLFSGHEDASARAKEESLADTDTLDESEDVQPQRKRPRTDEPPSSEHEVISLVSSDEEDGDAIQRTRRVPIPTLRRQRIGIGSVPDIPGSGEAIPSHPRQHKECPITLPPLDSREDGADGGAKRAGVDLRAELHQETDAIKPEHSFATPNNIPTSSNPEPYSVNRDDESSDQLRIPIKEPSLCPEQAELVDIILSGRNVFYTGSAGCGKSTVLKAFTRKFRDRGLQVDIVAPTGISALGVGGSTTFVYAGWSLSSFKRPLNKVRAGAHGKHVRKRLKATDVLVIDEISMVENFHFERLNAVMQEARGSYEPFGGVQVVVTGDFHQLPPVKPFENCLECGEDLVHNRSQESYSCKKHGVFHDEDKWAFKSEAWGLCNFVYFHLKTIHRQNDETFIKILQKCRIGQPLTSPDTDILMNHPCRTANATKLYARREEVRRHNQIRFDKLLSEKYTFTCVDEFNWNPEHEHLERYGRRSYDGTLESLKDHRFEATAEFKKGMLVVLLTNLDLRGRLCNGSQGIICDYEEYDPKKLPRVPTAKDPSPEYGTIAGEYAEMREHQVRIFMERKQITKKYWPVVRFHNGQVRTIYAECSVHSLGNKEPYSLLSRTQIPLAPAWAMSIHKSQSLTLDRVIVDLTRAWEEGQVYVALSRATSLYGLKIEGDPRGLAVGKGGNSEVRKFHMEKFGI